MTVSSLAKKLVGVNNIVIENVELEATSVGEQIVIRARPRKNAQCRCGVCGRKCSRFDHGKGLRRWRAPDLGAGTMIFIDAEAPRVNCPEHGVVVQQVPWARHKFRFTRSLCIDSFHVVSWCTELLDAVRKEEWNKARMELSAEREGQPKRGRGRQKGGQTEKTAAEQRVETVKSAKYPLLMNPDNLNERYKTELQQIMLRDRRLATAYRLKEDLRLIFKLPVEEVGAAIEKWRRHAWSCRIPQFVELQRKFKRHKNAILATIRYGISNARMEATNNKVKLTIRMACGFRNIDHLISAIFLRCGTLPIYLPDRQPLPATHTL